LEGAFRLPTVSCSFYTPTFESEEAFFNQRSRTNGHRIKHAKVDANTGREVVPGRSEQEPGIWLRNRMQRQRWTVLCGLVG
jgi:non-homologous end joining protein Ku